jgi:outer membrane receptor protein involved in Fe transport
MRNGLKAFLLATSGGACVLAGSVAHAQDAAGDTATMSEIVVTAQKKSERLLDVPVSVATVSGESLAQQNLVQIRDFYNRVPGVSLSGGGTEQRANGVAIRGITTGGGTASTVAFVLDDVPLTSGAASAQSPLIDVDPSDLQRVEILRGPQGTLYGASSLGGLVKYVTISPDTEQFSGRVEAGGNTIAKGDEGWSLRGAVNLPIVRDKLALRVSGFTRHDPAYLDNINTTAAGDDINKNRVQGGRAALLFKPTDTFSLDLSAVRQRSKFFGSPQIRVCPSCGTGAFTGTPSFAPYYGDLTLNLAPTKRDVSFTLYQGRANLDLGFADLTSISAWDRVKSASDLDQTNTFRFLLSAFSAAGGSVSLINADQTEKFSQEIRLASKSEGPLEWLVGGFYTHEKIAVNQVLIVHPTTGSGATAYTSVAPAKFEEKSLFADATYHFTPAFDVQVGARYSSNDQDSGSSTIIASQAVRFFGPSSSEPSSKSSDDAFTWLITPSYKISPDMMAYLRIATGYRPGGPNASGVTGIPLSFQSDSVVSYEAGLKGVIPSLKATYEAALFQIDWDDIQLLTTDVVSQFTYYTNGSTARSRGLELSGRWAPVRGLSIDGAATYLDAKLTDGLRSPVGASPIYGSKGDRLPGSAKTSASLSAQYDWSVGHDISAFVGAGLAYVGDRYAEFANVLPTATANAAYGARVKLPSYTTFDLRAGAYNDDWRLTAYVKNIGDKRGVVEATTRGGTSSPQAIFLQPRTVGATLSRSF